MFEGAVAAAVAAAVTAPEVVALCEDEFAVFHIEFVVFQHSSVKRFLRYW